MPELLDVDEGLDKVLLLTDDVVDVTELLTRLSVSDLSSSSAGGVAGSAAAGSCSWFGFGSR